MKIIITTVGTSLFTNYMKYAQENNLDGIANDFNPLEDKSPAANEIDSPDYLDYCDNIRYSLRTNWLNSGRKNICAEIQSTLQFIGDEDKYADYQVHLIATDTVLSRLAAELIADVLNENYGIKAIFNTQKDAVNNLVITDKKKFDEGMKFLFERLYQIFDASQSGNTYYQEQFALNITGGFKGVIPFMSIFGQVNKIRTFYQFENTNALIYIPFIPIAVSDEIFEQNFELFLNIERMKVKPEDVTDYELRENIKALCYPLEDTGNVFWLNELGTIFFERVKGRYFGFYASDHVWDKIRGSEKIMNTLRNSFSKKDIRESKTEKKPSNNPTHKNYDGGRTNPRLFYFENEHYEVFIYEAFESHNQVYEGYLKTLERISVDEVKNSYPSSAKFRKVFLLDV